MPRNDQITRQWHLLRQLEGSPGRTLQDLVESVPDDYPKNARRQGVRHLLIYPFYSRFEVKESLMTKRVAHRRKPGQR
jgi:hypothetical protein